MISTFVYFYVHLTDILFAFAFDTYIHTSTAIACYQKGEFCRSENRVRESIQWLQVLVKYPLDY